MPNLVEQLFEKVSAERKRIVIIGDTMVDLWIHGQIAECQDGCFKFMEEEVVDTPGGAANAERSISNWGVETSLYGFATDDCPIKCRYVRDGVILFRADSNEMPDRGERYQWARNMAEEMTWCAGGVLLSDYDKGFLTPEFIRQIANICATRGVPCVADCKRAPEIYPNCVLKGNSYWSYKYDNGLWWHKVKSPWVITLGGNQCVINDGTGYDKTECCGVTKPVNCVNHVGAGDCFAAHLTLALAYGFSLKEAAAIAHSAGRVYVQYPHNRPPTPVEIIVDASSGS